NPTKCVLCGTCIKNCPTQSIKLIDGKIVINRDTCIKCRLCADNCLAEAIYFIGQTKTISEIMKIILKDKEYYEVSNG
ncbi:4Fe-4S binding protein, partial [Erysipelatoclostridium ramosum]|uniref:4Fe-4S binding protein n=1 Tax=Thomasclavelia ramosa TaxID=1547 RepID=UPI001D08B43D|nr:4Fe-4S binding protein [Thomasclavelia ramosa]